MKHLIQNRLKSVIQIYKSKHKKGRSRELVLSVHHIFWYSEHYKSPYRPDLIRTWHAPRNSQVSKISKCQWISEPTSKKELWRTRPFSDLRTTTWSWRRSRGPCSGESLRWGWWWSPSPSWRGSCPTIGSSQPETGDNFSSFCWFFYLLDFYF